MLHGSVGARRAKICGKYEVGDMENSDVKMESVDRADDTSMAPNQSSAHDAPAAGRNAAERAALLSRNRMDDG
ncbi:hypothetical protein GWI33_016703 [Rhynchophorus ferrugineus]|uniref:Uncharacterized protein n=1 Tax=Rhynchophorus ferrugineus TaxID=354439 RepID=A0A834HWV3_RHYFE|nr:hypothetical protein GWI33_016703 [Rhynchophorus ferrugineus]